MSQIHSAVIVIVNMARLKKPQTLNENCLHYLKRWLLRLLIQNQEVSLVDLRDQICPWLTVNCAKQLLEMIMQDSDQDPKHKVDAVHVLTSSISREEKGRHFCSNILVFIFVFHRVT